MNRVNFVIRYGNIIKRVFVLNFIDEFYTLEHNYIKTCIMFIYSIKNVMLYKIINIVKNSHCVIQYHGLKISHYKLKVDFH